LEEINKNITEEAKKEVDLLLDVVNEFNELEIKYLVSNIRKHFMKFHNVDVMNLNLHSPQFMNICM